jgi:hypothetical protein
MTIARSATAAIAMLSAALAWGLPGAYRNLPFLQTDSPTYLAWDPSRPIAYPLFLSAYGWIAHDLAGLGAMQFVIFVSAAAYLALTLGRGARFAAFAPLFAACVMLHPQVISYAFTVLPEALLSATLMVHLAATVRLLHEPTRTRGLISGLTLAAAILLKPAAMAFLVAAPIIVFQVGRRAGRATLMAWGLALVLPILIASTINVPRLGVFAPQAMGGYAVVGVTGTFMRPETPVPPPVPAVALQAALRPLIEELRALPSLEMYYFYSSTAYHTALVRSREIILEALRKEHPHATDRQLFVLLNDHCGRLARATLMHAPREYAHHVAAHLYGLWFMPLVQNARARPALEQQLAAVQRDAPLLAQDAISFRFVPGAAYWAYKTFLAGALIGSIVSLVAWAMRPRAAAFVLLGHASLLLHAYYLLTAATQTGLPRYALTVWPLTTMAVLALAVIPLARHGTPDDVRREAAL